MLIQESKLLFVDEESYNDIPEIDYNSLMEISNIFEEYVDNDEYSLSEAFTDNLKNPKIEAFKAKINSIKDLKNQWAKLSNSMITHKWITRYINDKQEEMLNKYLNIMNKDDVTWHEYRVAFIQICKFFGLPNKGVVIEWLEFQDKKNEGRIAACRYSKGISKVNIPDNVKLTHFSTVNNLTELIPTFKSKTKGKFFYDSSRVYFTIKEKLNPFKFGVDRKVTRVCYQTVDHIPVAYIDPTYILFRDRCVYVDTEKPIKVQRVGETSGRNILSGVKKDKNIVNSNNETYNLFSEPHINQFTIQENNKVENIEEADSNWRLQEDDTAKKRFESSNVLEQDYQRLNDLVNIMRTCKGYNEYKKAFDEFCNYCHINPNGTILTDITIKSGKTPDTNYIKVDYSYNTRKVQLPEDAKLYHMSSVAGLTELKPFFRGKSAKGFLYDKPRIYLTTKKRMPKFAADYKSNEQVHQYEVTDNIKTSDIYVDPLLPNKLASAVYIETLKPIKCKEVEVRK